MDLPYQTLVEALLAAPAERPFVTMWHGEGETESVTFGEFRERASSLAQVLAAEGVAEKDRVVLVMPQGIELMAAFAGAMLLGAVPAILAYPNFKVEPRKYRDGLAGVTANLRARVVLLDEKFPDKLFQHISLTDGTKVLRTGRALQATAAPLRPVESDGLAFIQHSAGTTGLQKGVALDHGSVLRQLRHLAEAIRLEAQDSVYSWLPLYHDMGLIACFMLPMAFHLPLVMQSPVSWVMAPGSALELISTHRCSLAWMPNFAFQFMARRMAAEDRERLDLSSLRLLINCAEPVRASSIDELLAAFGPQGLRREAPSACYAMAENVFAVTQTPTDPPQCPRRLWVDGERLRVAHAAAPVAEDAQGAVCLVSSGRCLAENRFRVLDADGNELPDGAVGEIVIASDSLLVGYYNRPDLTAKVLRDGCYWTGDLGFCWEDELYVIGRKKDLIIIAGHNIYPQDVEEIVCRHPSVHDGRCVALGLFNEERGTEDLVAVAEVESEADLEQALAIERAAASTTLVELGVALRRLYLKPRGWLVKSTAGKPARGATRDKLLVEIEAESGGRP